MWRKGRKIHKIISKQINIFNKIYFFNLFFYLYMEKCFMHTPKSHPALHAPTGGFRGSVELGRTILQRTPIKKIISLL